MTTFAPYTPRFTTSVLLQSGIYHLVRKVEKQIDTVTTYIRMWKQRRQFLELLKFSDRMLADMGLTRSSIERAAKLPLHVNIAKTAREFARKDCIENQTFWHSGRLTGPSGPDRQSAISGLFTLTR